MLQSLLKVTRDLLVQMNCFTQLISVSNIEYLESYLTICKTASVCDVVRMGLAVTKEDVIIKIDGSHNMLYFLEEGFLTSFFLENMLINLPLAFLNNNRMNGINATSHRLGHDLDTSQSVPIVNQK
ncbi:hypothetical protein ACJX0J_025411 [Zea mays]